MSRFEEWDGDDDERHLSVMWMGRAKMALHSKRGRAALLDLREALLALPEHRLIESALCRPKIEDDQVVGGEVCVIGAYLWHQKVKAGLDPAAAFAELPTLEVSADDDYVDWDEQPGYQTAKAGEQAGLTFTLAYELASHNDDGISVAATPEQRWRDMVAYVDRLLAAPAITRPAPKPKRIRRAIAAKVFGKRRLRADEVGSIPFGW
jgi:hypothetical protein